MISRGSSWKQADVCAERSEIFSAASFNGIILLKCWFVVLSFSILAVKTGNALTACCTGFTVV